jgi:nucleotide-binding universal stress UspA family protein
VIYGFDDLFEAAEFERLDRRSEGRERSPNVTMQGTKQQPGRAAPAAAPPRMQLTAVQRGRVERPPVVLLYGVEGVGKSSWAANAPEPIFMDLEAGTDRLDVARFPKPESWDDVMYAINQLTLDQHDYRTLVVDTLDALEPLCWAHVCERGGHPDIEAFGYGKGYTAALDQWRVFAAALERLIRQRNMGVILLAHSWIRPFKNPEGDDFDRYELKLNLKAGGFLKEWSEAVLFARYETFANKDAKTKRVRGVSTGARIVHTVRTAAYDAKNRYNLPDEMPLDWQLFADAIAARRPADPTALAGRIEEMLAELATLAPDADRETKVRDAVVAAQGDAVRLARIADRLTAILNLKTQETAQ